VIEKILRDYLIAQAGVNTYVGAGTGARVYFDMIPQHVYADATRLSCLVINTFGSDREMNSCETLDQVTRRVQIDAYARSRHDANLLADATRAALVDYDGDMGGTFIDFIRIDDEWNQLDPEPGLFRRCLRLRIRHHE
jgi:hypothetical protein